MWKLRLREVELLKSHSRAQGKPCAFSEPGHMFKVLEHKYVCSRNPWAKNISEVVVLVQNPRQVTLSACFPRTNHYSNTEVTIFANFPWISQRVINKHININIKSTIIQFWKNTKVIKCQLKWPWFTPITCMEGTAVQSSLSRIQESEHGFLLFPSHVWLQALVCTDVFHLYTMSLTHMWPSLFF